MKGLDSVMTLYNGITYVGILDKVDFFYVKHACIYKQLILNNTFQLPESKPDIESIITVIVEPCITRSKLIQTPNEKKLILQGIIKIKIVYVTDNSEQSVHSAHFIQNFYTYINCHFHDLDCFDIKECIKAIPYIEDVEVISAEKRCFELTSLILLTVKNCCKKLTCSK